MLRLRVLSALVMAPVALLAAWAGFPVFDAFVAVAAALMVWEWDRMSLGEFSRLGGVVAGALSALVLLASHLPMLSLVLVGVGSAVLALKSERRWLAWGLAYIGVPVISLVWLRLVGGAWSLLWLLLIVWATDVGAYAAGRTIGGAKLAPRISPNKTWAGLIGGAVAAVVSGLALSVVVGIQHWAILALFAAVLAVVSQMGDLYESSVKRRFQVKDSSNIIPGHGGVLDRVDGLMAAAVAMAVAISLMGTGVEQW